ncbi:MULTISPECIES: hypothetical protein [Acinetobacter]|jgi:hypothetical protein|uniref:GPI inositol-deacylase PGAP1-like alpha/beta domain-containing protein n=2 Tax=Acinetobacter TaxID=469 RepID=A0A242U520_ACIPI|nr:MULTISPECIES: hypothetical protein [Acinetobacter]MBJ8501890.1 hypothetical protein [Acinetobacter pittii]MBJ9892323.1 hypothetical protein [Acinetobacter pittii]MCU4362141.1 alpha/beta hydrolase [Acinetobacter sp. WU_MDCI_Abxc22]MCU4479462.1 alpha/beta hydrolase [Acinetobacter sp. WU_MDCI_Abxd143]MDO7362288.1 hypothetical protein [Acinetobacter geminorum]
MKIIFIHGMNQQNYTAHRLKEHWLKVFKLGLKQMPCRVNIRDLHIHMPFYGDLMTKYQLSNQLDLNTLLPKSFFNNYFPINVHPSNPPPKEHTPFVPLLRPSTDQAEQSFSERLYLTSQLVKDRVLKELVVLLNNFPKLHESLIQQFLIETYMYLSNPEFMQEVHQRILKKMREEEDYIVVGHSLGSVIAFQLLSDPSYQFSVKRFITLASPLAFRVIQSKLPNPISRPPCIHGDWFNFYSQDDFLTAFPLCEAPFNFDPAIINQKIYTFAHQPHEILGYLQHPSVIKAIIEPFQKNEG